MECRLNLTAKQLALAIFLSVSLLEVPLAEEAGGLKIEELREEAGRGDVQAQYDLGLAYDEGKGVAEDDSEAMKWWRRAAGKGHANALLGLGLGYGLGRGVPKDPAKAKEYFGKACNAGSQPGCDQYTYLEKSGVRQPAGTKKPKSGPAAAGRFSF